MNKQKELRQLLDSTFPITNPTSALPATPAPDYFSRKQFLKTLCIFGLFSPLLKSYTARTEKQHFHTLLDKQEFTGVKRQ